MCMGGDLLCLFGKNYLDKLSWEGFCIIVCTFVLLGLDIAWIGDRQWAMGVSLGVE